MAGGSHRKGRRAGQGAGDGGSSGGAGEATLDEFLLNSSLDELREFLEADYLPVDADPEFKERLRSELWELVRTRIALGGGGSKPGG